MKADQLRIKTIKELSEELGALLRAQCTLRLRIATQQANGTAELRSLRRTIARVRTLMTEKAA